MHSFPVSATISAVKKRRKETVATEQVKAFCRIYREPVLELCTEEKKIHQEKFIS